MLRGLGVQKSELWVAGAGFANRSERAGEGLTFTCCRVVAPQDVRPAAPDVDQLVLRMKCVFCARTRVSSRPTSAPTHLSDQGW
eukprot:7387330-Prymnesium_polylepis.1